MPTAPKTEITSYCCGVCFDMREAHFAPTACFACGTVFEGRRLAPIALATISVDDADLERPAEQRVRFLGHWSIEARELAMLRFVVGREEDDAPRRVDSGQP